MAWAVLAFPETPREFRSGLVRIALDEIRHMHLYAGQIARLGFRVGEFPVRDWFWELVPRCGDGASFVATMGLGVESANLSTPRLSRRGFVRRGTRRARASRSASGARRSATSSLGRAGSRRFARRSSSRRGASRCLRRCPRSSCAAGRSSARRVAGPVRPSASLRRGSRHGSPIRLGPEPRR